MKILFVIFLKIFTRNIKFLVLYLSSSLFSPPSLLIIFQIFVLFSHIYKPIFGFDFFVTFFPIFIQSTMIYWFRWRGFAFRYNLGEEEERSTSMTSLTTRRKRGFGCCWRREEEKRGLWWWWVGTPAPTDGAWLWWSACMVVVLHDIVKKMKKWQIVVFFKI